MGEGRAGRRERVSIRTENEGCKEGKDEFKIKPVNCADCTFGQGGATLPVSTAGERRKEKQRKRKAVRSG